MDCPVGFFCQDGECIEGGAPAGDAQVDAADDSDAMSAFDAMVTDALSVDICQEAMSAPNSDSCSVASVNVTEAARAGGVTMYGDTTTYINDLGSPPSQIACLGYITAGVDAFYRVDAVAGETISARVYGASWDTALYLTAGCTTGVTCFTGADTLNGTNEQIDYTVVANGTFYIAVDTSTTGVGCYAIDISIETL